MVQNVKPDCRSKSCVGSTVCIDLGCKFIERAFMGRRDFSERLPEFVLERDTCAVTAQGK